jgi:DNA (cytosine-5)-methyltransferase 1
MRSISLFTGAGGLDLGCEAAGFETHAVVENNPLALATIDANSARYFNHLRAKAIFDDVTRVDVEELLDVADPSRDQIDLVHGGPPCTPFSKSGYWLEYKRRGADPRASLLDDFVRIVALVQPRAFLMENVYGLAYKNQNRPVFDRFKKGMDKAGFTFDSRPLLAADYGVPQLRQRLLCVGIRKDLLENPRGWSFYWPDPVYSGPHETRRRSIDNLPHHPTAGEALEGLADAMNPPEPEEVVAGTYAEELREIPPGENYLYWTRERGHAAPRFRWRSRYWSFLLKLHPDRPSPTIQGQPGPWVGPFHWENRRLRVAEAKRLMGFPDDFVVLGTRREKQLQLGNAVPPELARVVAEALAKELSRLGVARSSDLAVAAA